MSLIAVVCTGSACGYEQLVAERGCQGSESLVDRGHFCPEGEDLAAWVDPMIGAEGSGNAIPGALVPHGMVKLSPDSVVGDGSVDAYEYGSSAIEGFSHTHLEGPGGSFNGYSHLLIMPDVGPLAVEPDAIASSFSHGSEVATPGYYAVTLEDSQVRVELTATGHAGLHRYTFPASTEARVLIDLRHSRGDSRGGEVRIVGDDTIEGFGRYNVHPLLDLALSTPEAETGRSTVFFVAELSRPFAGFGTWRQVGSDRIVTEGARQASGMWIGAYAGWSAGQ